MGALLLAWGQRGPRLTPMGVRGASLPERAADDHAGRGGAVAKGVTPSPRAALKPSTSVT
jgi:hypothetical protein